MSEEKQRPREFIPVEDAQEARSLLREGAKTVASAIVWTRNQEHVLNTHMNVFSDVDQAFYAWVPPNKELDVEKFVDEVIKLDIRECFFSVSLSRANIFFKAEFLGHDPGGLKFRLPEKVFKVQRRSDLRFPVPDGHVIKVDHRDPVFPNQVHTRKVINLSASGMALLVPLDQMIHYQPEMALTGVSFTLKQRKITCDAEVRHIKPLPADSRHNPGALMGVLFKGIKQGDSDWIASYVFEESRKFYSKFM